MKNQEIVIRVVIESAGTKTAAPVGRPKGSRGRSYKRQGVAFPRATYDQIDALAVGQSVNIDAEAQAARTTLHTVKKRISTFQWAMRKLHGDGRRFMAYRNGSGIEVSRTA